MSVFLVHFETILFVTSDTHHDTKDQMLRYTTDVKLMGAT